MTQYREGQEVEIWIGPPYGGAACRWRKAKIVELKLKGYGAADYYEVQFPDGTSALSGAEHIRATGNLSHLGRPTDLVAIALGEDY